MSVRPNPELPHRGKGRVAHWTERNFITEVLLPSWFTRRTGTQHRPLFPTLTAGQICVTWIGHASFLIQTRRHNILIDPNWANWMVIIRRLRRAGIPLSHLPRIDLVLITHAHFDHLHRRSLSAVAAQQPIVVPSGVHNLVYDLGFERVHEMKWWEQWSFRDLRITFTPAKHWGARVLADGHRGYGGYVIEYEGRSIYHCGDSAWFSGFSEIGRKLHPEIALLPIGCYQNPSGRDVHMEPEQAVEAFAQLQSKMLVPMHYGTYRMSYEPMNEPIQRLLAAGEKAKITDQIKVLSEGTPVVV